MYELRRGLVTWNGQPLVDNTLTVEETEPDETEPDGSPIKITMVRGDNVMWFRCLLYIGEDDPAAKEETKEDVKEEAVKEEIKEAEKGETNEKD